MNATPTPNAPVSAARAPDHREVVVPLPTCPRCSRPCVFYSPLRCTACGYGSLADPSVAGAAALPAGPDRKPGP